MAQQADLSAKDTLLKYISMLPQRIPGGSKFDRVAFLSKLARAYKGVL